MATRNPAHGTPGLGKSERIELLTYTVFQQPARAWTSWHAGRQSAQPQPPRTHPVDESIGGTSFNGPNVRLTICESRFVCTLFGRAYLEKNNG